MPSASGKNKVDTLVGLIFDHTGTDKKEEL
jgi:hypothetical protein